MRVIILAGTGGAGRATAAEFATAGWEVIATGRDPRRFPAELVTRGVSYLQSDRHDRAQLRAVMQDGADLVVDCGCYSAEHASQLLAHRAVFGSAVMLSGKAVYVDDLGRHANSDEVPRFAEPVREDQAILEPDFSGDYRSPLGYGTNKVAAELTLTDGDAAVSILRPSRIYGPGSRQPREWFVLSRLLAGHARLELAHHGRTANPPTAPANLARLVRACAAEPATRILNAADPEPATAAEIATAIASAAGRPLEIVGLDGDAPQDRGASPWDNWPPFLLDTSAAESLTGYEPAGSYAEFVGPAVQDLLALSSGRRAELGLADAPAQPPRR